MLESAAAEPTELATNVIVPALTKPTPAMTTADAPTALVLPAQEPDAVVDEIARILRETFPPIRDDIRLAKAFRGLSGDDVPDQLLSANRPSVGTKQKFRIYNVVDNTIGDIEAELIAISDHAYFWFDVDPESPTPSDIEVREVGDAFDAIYENVVNHFGMESKPGIDGDPRLHVVNASAMSLCGVAEDMASNCLLAGLVQPSDILPREVDPRSNEREMFIMNAHRFGGDYYLGVLAHELRHMIEDNYDRADSDWEKEGSATLAAQLAGYKSAGIERGNLFLANPDQQLNSWTDGDTSSHYGQGYLLNRYIYDRLGAKLYYQFATNSLPGLQAVDSIAQDNGLDISGDSLWLDWLVALIVHNEPLADEIYQFESDGLQTATYIPVDTLPAEFQESVSQYAADYYEIPAYANEVIFKGQEDVSLLGLNPISGHRFWFSQRGNNINPRLTREIDLKGVDRATLSYQAYIDIEHGYDFAYVSVSTDGGNTWLPIVGENMAGADPADNPAGSAFTDRFYTGRNGTWVEEKIDMGSFAGQTILLRFEYVTDPILTYGGFALDDIIIPEIGFYDDVEKLDSGWQAEGFVRATTTLPQNWHLQLITYDEDRPVVHKIEVDSSSETAISLDSYNLRQSAMLIVAATAPTTLQPAKYELIIR
ncbi:MAG: immune inhibitor A [Candidatus Promineifilaceae bacterium]|nr:immune inhibitor A [Candidatus Promineifilaceae bacterium]